MTDRRADRRHPPSRTVVLVAVLVGVLCAASAVGVVGAEEASGGAGWSPGVGAEPGVGVGAGTGAGDRAGDLPVPGRVPAENGSVGGSEPTGNSTGTGTARKGQTVVYSFEEDRELDRVGDPLEPGQVHGQGPDAEPLPGLDAPAPDERTRVEDPWDGLTRHRSIVQVRMRFNDSGEITTSSCSGTVVDAYHVLTAAHCVDIGLYGGWASNITVAPMADNQSGTTIEPFSIAEARIVRAYEAYIDDADPDHDVAMLTLDRSIGEPNATRTMDWKAYPHGDPVYYQETVYNQGYPGTPPDSSVGYPSLWADSGEGLGHASTKTFRADVIASGGHSGGPMYHHTDDHGYEILGVLAYGPNPPWGPRITFAKETDFDAWTDSTRYVDPPEDSPEFVFDGFGFTAEAAELSVSPTDGIIRGITEVTFEHTIRNVGTARGTDEIPLSVRAASPDGCDWADPVVTTGTASAPGAFNETEVALTTTIPRDTQLGDLDVCLTIDADVDEFDDQPARHNRTATETLTLKPIPSSEVGDVDRDGEVSIVDAVRIQRHLAELDPGPFEPELADVQRTGQVSIVDAVLLQRYLAEIARNGTAEIRELRAPGTVTGGDPLGVSAMLGNDGDVGTIGTATFKLLDDTASNGTEVTEPVDLAPNSTASTNATVPTKKLPPGNYTLVVETEDDRATTEVAVTASSSEPRATTGVAATGVAGVGETGATPDGRDTGAAPVGPEWAAGTIDGDDPARNDSHRTPKGQTVVYSFEEDRELDRVGEPLAAGASSSGAEVAPFREAETPGQHDRTRVEDPWNASSRHESVVQVRMRYVANGTELYGGCTGTIVDNYHVLTAAHCLYSTLEEAWATNVTVAPMAGNQSGTTIEPYSIAEARIARTYEAYVDSDAPEHDVAMLTLDRSIGVPSATRTMDWGAYPANDSVYYKNTVYNHGYPAAPPDGTSGYPSLWEDVGPGLGYRAGFPNTSFAVGVVSSGGHSGGPFYHYDSATDSYELLGVLASRPAQPWGPRVTFAKADDFDNWTASARYVDPPDDRPEFVFEGFNFTAEQHSLSVSPTEEIVPGVTEVTFEHTIRNVGTARGTDEVSLSVRAAGSDGCDRSDPVVTTGAVPAPDAFEATAVALTTTIPEDAPLGEVELCLTIDEDTEEFDDQPPAANRTGTETVTVAPTSAHTIGDVDRDGEVSIVDAVRIQRYLAELDPGPFEPELADVERTGEVSIVDAVRIQRYLAEIDQNGTAGISDLDVPATVTGGEPLDVSATLANDGDMGTVQTMTAQLTNATLAASATIAVSEAVVANGTVAIEPIDLAPGTTGDVDATVPTDPLPPGTYTLTVATDDDTATATVEITPQQ